MALTDHVAILLGHSLDVARLNLKKTRSDFYAQVAVPPAAAADIAELVSAVYPGVPLANISVNFGTNASQPKPFVGVPGDWFVFRLASAFAPELFAADGVTQIQPVAARQHFFSGQKVRVNSSAWAWKNEFGKSGASFNLLGLMDAGMGGERMQIGSAGQSAAAFKAHANPNAVGSGTAANPFGQQAQQMAAPAAVQQAQQAAQSVSQAANPFGGAAQQAQGANPFAQAAAPQAGNPFAQ